MCQNIFLQIYPNLLFIFEVPSRGIFLDFQWSKHRGLFFIPYSFLETKSEKRFNNITHNIIIYFKILVSWLTDVQFVFTALHSTNQSKCYF